MVLVFVDFLLKQKMNKNLKILSICAIVTTKRKAKIVNYKCKSACFIEF